MGRLFRPAMGLILLVQTFALLIWSATAALSEEKQLCMPRDKLFASAHQYAYGFAFQEKEMAVLVIIPEDGVKVTLVFKYSPLSDEYCTVIDA